MSLGDRNYQQGGKGSQHGYEHRSLLALGEIITALGGGGGGGGLATEATLISVLNAIVASDQDIEILLVRDTGNSDEVVQQITNYETGVPVVTYKDVNGNAYVPVGPLEYLDPSAVMNLMLTELLDQGLTLDAIDANTDGLEALLTAIDTVLDNIKLDTANLDVALSTRATEATLVSTNALLTTIDAVLDTIKTDTALMVTDLAAIEVLLTTTNALLTTIDGVLDTIKVDTGVLATPVTGLAVALTNVVGAGAASVAAGKRRVTFANVGNADITAAGGTISRGRIVTFSADGLRDTLAAIPYNALTSEILISTVG
jgi:hypothetical protein